MTFKNKQPETINMKDFDNFCRRLDEQQEEYYLGAEEESEEDE